MKKIEILGLDYSDLQKMLDESHERLLQKIATDNEKPSEYESLTLEDAAKELRCHKATIRRKMLERGIKGSKVGKEIMIQRKDLKRLCQAL